MSPCIQICCVISLQNVMMGINHNNNNNNNNNDNNNNDNMSVNCSEVTILKTTLLMNVSSYLNGLYRNSP